MNTRRVIGIYPSENKVLNKLKLLKKDGMETEHMIIVNPSEPQKNPPAPTNILQKLMMIGVSENEAKLYADVLKEGQYILLNTVTHKEYLT
ncbi:hypothetical protein SAMN04488137_3037 [Fictibacillus solisalsi]|uniref:Heat induced stress protein YflT n=1 Tax=Fictibacillus solisalsi TaxID=459525 RepID=A0A1G9XVR2_9BACL|nr:hypothetical protein [Fictibacillus solisalsi]SDN00820.1 hypothetical protein SAMN04488137_3037 [Fictibacillus solisalsi]